MAWGGGSGRLGSATIAEPAMAETACCARGCMAVSLTLSPFLPTRSPVFILMLGHSSMEAFGSPDIPPLVLAAGGGTWDVGLWGQGQKTSP